MSTFILAAILLAVVPPVVDSFHHWFARKIGMRFDQRSYRYLKKGEDDQQGD